MQTTAKLYAYGYADVRTYLFAALFVVGNVVLPQLIHLIPQGGLTWLPIYFFTLVGAYKYGWRVGLLTAIASPLLNSWLFGMPATAMLPGILVKSVLLAAAAGYAAHRFRRASLWFLLAVVASYQLAGTAFEWIMSGSLFAAAQDFRLGLPGMAVQVFGGYLFINHVTVR